MCRLAGVQPAGWVADTVTRHPSGDDGDLGWPDLQQCCDPAMTQRQARDEVPPPTAATATAHAARTLEKSLSLPSLPSLDE